MIAPWIVYCVAVGVVLSLAALATERALRACALPTRWAWAGALLLTLAVPAATRLLPGEAPPAPLRSAAPASAMAAGERVSWDDLPLRAPAPRRVDLAALDRPLLLAWGAASAATLLGLLAMAAALRRRRARWRAEELDGVPVLVSRDTGPAVVGLFRGRIVLPEWAVGADPERRDLLLEHELEHLRAGDPRLLAAGLAALVLFPWNPAVWWQLRRLRLAVEIDCDARVLRRRADVRAYGSLLLEVGCRACGSPVAAAAFSEPASFLERRIRIMTMPRERSPWLRTAGFGALALGLVAAACETPAPTSLAPAPTERVYSAADAPDGPLRSRVGPRELVAEHFPDVLSRGMEGNEHVLFVVDHAGEVVTATMGKRGHFVAEAAPAGDGARLRVRAEGGVAAVPGRRSEFRVGTAGDLGVEPGRIEAVDVTRFRAGELGPDPVGVVRVRLRDPDAPATATGGVAVASGAPVAGGVPAAAGESVALGEPVALGKPAAGGSASITVLGRPAGRAGGGTAMGGGADARVSVRGDRVTVADGGASASGEHAPPVDPATVVAAIERRHPEVAAGRVPDEPLWFVVGADGGVLRSGVARDVDPDTIAPDGIRAVNVFKGGPVQVNGRDVEVIWIRLKA